MLKTSEQWAIQHKDKYTILEPDGWDRKNYQYSWFEERITQEEFLDRVSNSTCIFRDVRMTGTVKAVEDIINQVEMLLGPLNTESSVVFGDDDKSILRHNVYVILQKYRKYLTE